MNVLISGGCKNGKSHDAQKLAKKIAQPEKPLYYLATMVPVDLEDRQRIEKHRSDREGWGFETIEISRDILTATRHCDPSGSFLLDSITALLANEMFEKEGTVVPNASRKVADDLRQLAEKVKNIVFVSDEIHSDASLYDPVTNEYRKGLAHIGKTLAQVCDYVLEAVCGNLIVHKPAPQVLAATSTFY